MRPIRRFVLCGICLIGRRLPARRPRPRELLGAHIGFLL